MRHIGRLVLRLLFLVLLVVPECHAGNNLRVNESKTKAQLRDQRMLVWLGINNSGSGRVRAHVQVELIDPKGESRGKAERDREIPAGESKVPLEIALPTVKPADLDAVFWYRVRYEIFPSESSGAPFEPIEGILSVSEIAPEMFELHVAYQMVAKIGEPFQAIVRAVQPVTSRPVANVKIRATLDVSDTDAIAPLQASATTDSRGYARVEFSLPANTDTDDPTLEITGERGGYTATLSDEETHTFHFATFLLNTDKPLYQPGQTLRARVLAFGPDHHAVANAPVELRIYDPEDTLVFRMNLKTSRFGIASTDWAIPGNQRLGTYRLQADFGAGDSEDGGGSATVKISRYELPDFTVSVNPDRAYYLPQQDASVEVRAEYLFGRPVTRGRVRVVRESDRQWNYREQKWDVEEGEAYEGEADASGRYLAKIDLSKEHKELADEDYTRFRDFTYTAYFTDATSGRTEHRRFDLRVTKDAIHIYVISPERIRGGNRVDFYLSTFYADGTPVPCDVAFRTVTAKPSDSGEMRPAQLLRTIRTNPYGVAKISDLTMPAARDGSESLSLQFVATDAKGASGTHTEDFWFYRSSELRVATDKTLYRPDDPIEVHLTSGFPEGAAEVEVLSDWRFITISNCAAVSWPGRGHVSAKREIPGPGDGSGLRTRPSALRAV